MAERAEGKGVVVQLREHIRASGRTLTDLSKECGVGKDRLSRFMRGERDLTFAAVEKICTALRLQLVQTPGAGPPAEAEAKPRKGRGKGK